MDGWGWFVCCFCGVVFGDGVLVKCVGFDDDIGC